MTCAPQDDPIHCALCALEHLNVVDYFDRDEDGMYRWVSRPGKDRNERESTRYYLDLDGTLAYLKRTVANPPDHVDLSAGHWRNLLQYVELAETSCPDAIKTYDFTPEEIEVLTTPAPEESGVLAGPLLDRIRELEADRDAFRDRALAAESALRQGSDALARILGRDEGLPLALHIPSVRMIVAGLEETQRERDALTEAAREVVEALSKDAPECCKECGGFATTWDSWGSNRRCDEHSSAGAKDYPYAEFWRRLCAMVKL